MLLIIFATALTVAAVVVAGFMEWRSEDQKLKSRAFVALVIVSVVGGFTSIYGSYRAQEAEELAKQEAEKRNVQLQERLDLTSQQLVVVRADLAREQADLKKITQWQGYLLDATGGTNDLMSSLSTEQKRFVEWKLQQVALRCVSKGDIANLAKTSDLGPLAKSADFAGVAKSSDLTGLAKTSDVAGIAKATDLSGLAKTSDLTGLAKSADLSGLAKTSDLNGLAKASDLTGLAKASDLTGLAKASDLTGLAKAADLSGLAKTSDLNGLARASDLSGLAKKSEANEKSGTPPTEKTP